MNPVRVKITKTWKSFSPRAEWESYDAESVEFRSLKEARDWLKDNMPTGKRQPIYVDTLSRGTIKAGYIIGWRVPSDDSAIASHLEQWWISFEEILRFPLPGQQGEVRSIDIGRAAP